MDFYSTLLAKKLNKASGGDVEVESLVVSENGRYSETGKAYNPVVVNVQPTLETLNATANGTYTPQGDGYSEVTVNVPLPENGYLLETETGNPITVTDAGAFPLASCDVDVEPIQEGSGTPSPDNVRPISGRSEVAIDRVGKNLFNIEQWLSTNSVSYVKDNNTYTFNTEISLFKNFYEFNKPINIILSSIREGGTATNVGFLFYDENDNELTGRILRGTINNAKKFRLDFSSGGSITLKDPMIRLSTETDPTYEPYAGKTYTIQVGDTIYGGELDVVTGELRVTHGEVDLGDLDWMYDGANIQRFWATLNGMKSVSAWNGIGFLCSNYSNGVPDVDGSGGDKIIGVKSSEIYIRDTSYTDAATFKNALQNSNAQLVYELATPITIDLTPTLIELLQGTNTISADDDLTIKYFGKGVN